MQSQQKAEAMEKKQSKSPNIWATFVIMNDLFTITGLYDDEQSAVKNCHHVEGVALMSVGQPFPMCLAELEKCYWPHQLPWTATPYFKQQHIAKTVVLEFLDKLGQGGSD